MSESPKIEVDDLVKTKVTITNSFTVEIIRLNLFTNATIRVKFFNNDSLLEISQYDLTDEEYNNWGNDDNYIYDLTASKYGLTIKTV